MALNTAACQLPLPSTHPALLCSPSIRDAVEQSLANDIETSFDKRLHKMTENLSKNFETLQLHAGYVYILTIATKVTYKICSAEPDPATNSRAVPIYATTVS